MSTPKKKSTRAISADARLQAFQQPEGGSSLGDVSGGSLGGGGGVSGPASKGKGYLNRGGIRTNTIAHDLFPKPPLMDVDAPSDPSDPSAPAPLYGALEALHAAGAWEEPKKLGPAIGEQQGGSSSSSGARSARRSGAGTSQRSKSVGKPGNLDYVKVTIIGAQWMAARHGAGGVGGGGVVGADESMVGSSLGTFCVCGLLGRPDATYTTPLATLTSQPQWNFFQVFQKLKKDSVLEFSIFERIRSSNTFKQPWYDTLVGFTTISAAEFAFKGFCGTLGIRDGNNRSLDGWLRVKVEPLESPGLLLAKEKKPAPSVFWPRSEVLPETSLPHWHGDTDECEVLRTQAWLSETLERVNKSCQVAQGGSDVRQGGKIPEPPPPPPPPAPTTYATKAKSRTASSLMSVSSGRLLEADTSVFEEVGLSTEEEELASTLLLMGFLKDVACANRRVLFPEATPKHSLTPEEQVVACFLQEVDASSQAYPHPKRNNRSQSTGRPSPRGTVSATPKRTPSKRRV